MSGMRAAAQAVNNRLEEAAEVRQRLDCVQVCGLLLSWAHNNIYILVLNSILLQAERDKLEGDVSRLEEELSIIAVASRTLTACTVIPVIGQ